MQKYGDAFSKSSSIFASLFLSLSPNVSYIKKFSLEKEREIETSSGHLKQIFLIKIRMID